MSTHSRHKCRASRSTLAPDAGITAGDYDSSTLSRELLSSGAHSLSLGRGHAGFKGAIGDGDDGGTSRRGETQEVLEGHEEDVARCQSSSEIVEC